MEFADWNFSWSHIKWGKAFNYCFEFSFSLQILTFFMVPTDISKSMPKVPILRGQFWTQLS